MSAPSTVQRIPGAPGAGYPQPPAPAQQLTPEKLRQIADAVVIQYAKLVGQGIQTMFKNEHIQCEKEGTDKGVGVATIRMPDGKVYTTKFRSERLHSGYSDASIDSKIEKLDVPHRYIFNALLKRTEELLDQPYSGFLRFIQADASNALNKNVLVQGAVSQSQIFKSQVYICVSKMSQDHKIVVLKGVSK